MFFQPFLKNHSYFVILSKEMRLGLSVKPVSAVYHRQSYWVFLNHLLENIYIIIKNNQICGTFMKEYELAVLHAAKIMLRLPQLP